ncbi:MAG: IS1/IS1595 family N-terminal zinc-binding domain-containing protein [Xenococcaceae cyanobacterium]
MECPTCRSKQIYKNGYRQQVQCYKCKRCGRQFLEYYRQQRYSESVKQLCLKMYLKGLKVREIERLTDIHHTTVINWIRQTDIDALVLLEED